MDKELKEALFDTVKNKGPKELQLLLYKGANINEFNKNLNPLHAATIHSKYENIKFLLEQGAQIESKTLGVDNDRDKTPLHLACEHGHLNIITLLLEWDARIDEQILCDTVRSGNLYVLQLLLDKVKPNKVPTLEALLTSIRHGKYDAMEMLLRNGAGDLNGTNKLGFNALHVAAYLGLLDAIKILLEWRVDVNGLNPRTKETALMYATKMSHLDIVKLLLLHGADANIRDDENLTALDYALERKQEEIISVLKENS